LFDPWFLTPFESCVRSGPEGSTHFIVKVPRKWCQCWSNALSQQRLWLRKIVGCMSATPSFSARSSWWPMFVRVLPPPACTQCTTRVNSVLEGGGQRRWWTHDSSHSQGMCAATEAHRRKTNKRQKRGSTQRGCGWCMCFMWTCVYVRVRVGVCLSVGTSAYQGGRGPRHLAATAVAQVADRGLSAGQPLPGTVP
jgi:hypothetical protein